MCIYFCYISQAKIHITCYIVHMYYICTHTHNMYNMYMYLCVYIGVVRCGLIGIGNIIFMITLCVFSCHHNSPASCVVACVSKLCATGQGVVRKKDNVCIVGCSMSCRNSSTSCYIHDCTHIIVVYSSMCCMCYMFVPSS